MSNLVISYFMGFGNIRRSWNGQEVKKIWQSVKYESRRLLVVQWLTIVTILSLWWNKTEPSFGCTVKWAGKLLGVKYSRVGKSGVSRKSGMKDTVSYLDCSQKLSSKPPLRASLQNRPEWKLYYTSRPLNYLLPLNVQTQSPLKLLCVSPFGTDFAEAVSKLWLTNHNAKVFVPGILTHTRYRVWVLLIYLRGPKCKKKACVTGREECPNTFLMVLFIALMSLHPHHSFCQGVFTLQYS